MTLENHSRSKTAREAVIQNHCAACDVLIQQVAKCQDSYGRNMSGCTAVGDAWTSPKQMDQVPGQSALKGTRRVTTKSAGFLRPTTNNQATNNQAERSTKTHSVVTRSCIHRNRTHSELRDNGPPALRNGGPRFRFRCFEPFRMNVSAWRCNV